MSTSIRRQQPDSAEARPTSSSAPGTTRSAAGTNQPPPRTPLPARHNLSSIPEVASPILQTPAAQNPSQGSSHRTVLLQTPGQRAAAQMTVQLDANIALATPGPVERRWQDAQGSDQSDGGDKHDDSEDSDELPVRLARRKPTGRTAVGTALQSQIISLNSDDSETKELEPDRGQGSGRSTAPRSQGSRGRGRVTSRAQADNTGASGPPTGLTVDDDGFAWADDSVLSAKTRAPDAKFFFGLHVASGSQKCRLCSVVYAKTSSLSTRRAHLEKKHVEEYLAEIQRRGWENKLPSASLDKLK
ncbi:hypothetical protein B0H14DRAFT_2594899 [Mycena olivaceomarginata]|nr:hypothetical protein B0H14DRAFT_2594899 [Mycena olivaceomarginata]